MPRRGIRNAITAFLRATPHTETQSVAAVIGSAGGTIKLPSSGIEIEIPEGALSQDSHVNLTAHPSVVGFTIALSPAQPLAKKARISQRLEAHHVSDAAPVLGHTDSIGYQSNCSELFQATVEGDIATAHVPHFSGYIFAGGINSGQPCNPDTDGPECIWVDDT